MNYELLKDYIEKSELRIVNDDFRIRLSPELAVEYDAGKYDAVINRYVENIKKLKALGIIYIGRADPIFYLYVVPRDSGEMLNMPGGMKRGGRPVASFDLDGFTVAFGITSGMLNIKTSISEDVGNIHEFAHLVHYMFFKYSGLWIAEGVAEAFPYYLLDYEKLDDDHRALILGLNESDILDARTLAYEFDQHRNYSGRAQLQPSYISAYLLVRGILKTIQEKHNCDKVAAMQKLLIFVGESTALKDYLIFEIADFIGVPREVLHKGKDLQRAVQADIASQV